MRYEHTPRPLVESHYHIRELIEAQDKRATDRTDSRERAKQREERAEDIKKAPLRETKPFWCDVCRLDFLAETIKEVEADWSNPAQDIAFYRSKCFKGHWAMRLVTDKHRDGYWAKSRQVALDRGRHTLDTIQPWETNYELLYSKKRA